MTMNPLPPQAYTKETMLKAYHWLQQQPPSIREMAMTPDILVSLYLKASRDGDQSLERPSIQNFKSELRELAGLMGELDRGGPAGAEATKPNAMPKASAVASTSATVQSPPPPSPASGAPSAGSSPGATFFNSSEPKAPPQPPPPRRSFVESNEALAFELQFLDSKSLEMLHETKDDFNLSCETEALRMLIKIGFAKAKTLLPSSSK